MSDLYSELGVAGDASTAEIRKAYRQAVKRTHPDQGGSREAFDRVQLAHNILTDESRRRRYDQTGSEDPTDPEALLRAQALTTVAAKMAEIIGSPNVDPRYYDLATGIRELLDHERQRIEQGIDGGRAMQERLRQFQRRLKRKAGLKGSDTVGPTIAAQVEAVGQQILNLEDQLKVVTAARELVDEYVYKTDAPEAVMVQTMMGGGAGYVSRYGMFDPGRGY